MPKRQGRKSSPAAAGPAKLLSGGNPQIAKADGDAPVQAYLAAMPGWKQEVGRMLDAIVSRELPQIAKAVRWNTPFYGVPGNGWFLSFHCFTKYLKVVFLNGSELQPPPPIESKYPAVRYWHITEGEDIDEVRLISWIHQAAALPGDRLFSLESE